MLALLRKDFWGCVDIQPASQLARHIGNNLQGFEHRYFSAGLIQCSVACVRFFGIWKD